MAKGKDRKRPMDFLHSWMGHWVSVNLLDGRQVRGELLTYSTHDLVLKLVDGSPMYLRKEAVVSMVPWKKR